MAMLAIALFCLILAGVFSPRIGAEAKANAPAPYAIEDVSSWLLRLAAWSPETPLERPTCPEAAITVGFWDFL